MDVTLRGLIQVGGLPDEEDTTNNWQAFQMSGIEHGCEEDHRIVKYLEIFHSQMSAPPDIGVVRDYFERDDDIEVVSRLEEVKKAPVRIRQNYKAHLRLLLEEQNKKNFILLCRDAAGIAEHGRHVDKKVLKGVPAAIGYLTEQADHIDRGANDWGKALVFADIGQPIEPIRYLLAHFRLAEGRPNILAGYAGSAKTFLACELAVAVACGLPCWGGLIPKIQGPVVHLDYEMGRKALLKRYQRICKGMGVNPSNIFGLPEPDGIRASVERAAEHKTRGREMLQLFCDRQTRLCDPTALQKFTRLCAGKALLIIDSFRAATAGSRIDENSSEMRQYLDMLGLVSDKTGCIILVLHHNRKDREDQTQDDPLQQMRGSSGIADSVGATVHVTRPKKGCLRLVQGKVSAGRAGESIAVALEDVGDYDKEWECTDGLRVITTDDQAQDERLSDRAIVEAVINKGGVKTKKEMYAQAALLGLKKHERVDAALAELPATKTSEGVWELREPEDLIE